MGNIFFTVMRFASKEEIQKFWEALAPAANKTFESYDWYFKTWCEKYHHLDAYDTDSAYDERAEFTNRFYEEKEELNALLSLIRDIQTSYEQYVEEVEELENDPFYINLWNILEKYS